MTETVYKYKVWCNTDSKYIEIWATTEPTTCPENNTHTIDTSKTSILEELTKTFPVSTIDGAKVAVHSSYKPEIPGHSTYAVWTGAGDDLTDDVAGNGDGDILQIHTEVGVPTTSVKIEFNPLYGRIWIHEAYIKFTGGGVGDYISSRIYARGVPLQQSVSLDLVLDGTDIKYSASGPGTGTHGFADPTKITLIDRAFSKDGDWDWDGETLTPNLVGDGDFKMSTIDTVTHRFINKVPCYGDCASYFSMSSDETSEIPDGYYAEFTAHNVSNTVWHVSAIMELYREVTYSE